MEAKHPHHMAKPKPKQSHATFRFFDLPKEIRDDVYKLCGQDLRLNSACKQWLPPFFGPYPRLPFLQVSRQFAAEYTEELSRQRRQPNILYVRGSGSPKDLEFFHLRSRIPSFAPHLNRLSLSLNQKYLHFTQTDEASIQECVKPLIRAFPSLQTLEIILYLNLDWYDGEPSVNQYLWGEASGFGCKHFYAMEVPFSGRVIFDYRVVAYVCINRALHSAQHGEVERAPYSRVANMCFCDCEKFTRLTYSVAPSRDPSRLGEYQMSKVQGGWRIREKLTKG